MKSNVKKYILLIAATIIFYWLWKQLTKLKKDVEKEISSKV